METKRYKRDLQGMETRQRRGMRMLKRGIAQAEVARELWVSRQTASAWAWRLSDDQQACRRHPLGKPSGLTATDKRKLAIKGAVANRFPTELWTQARVGKIIARGLEPSCSNVHVMRLLSELGFSCLKPEKRALQREEVAIAGVTFWNFYFRLFPGSIKTPQLI